MKKMTALFLTACVFLNAGCQKTPNDNANTADTTQKTAISDVKKLSIDNVIQETPIQFRKLTSNYPVLIGDEYKSVNDNIQALIKKLKDFDNEVNIVNITDDNDKVITENKENANTENHTQNNPTDPKTNTPDTTQNNKKDYMFEGVDSFGYSVVNFDETQLSLNIDYSMQDMTERYFNQYYQIDLTNKKQVHFADYLKEKNIDVDKLHQAINAYINDCKANKPDMVCDMGYPYLEANYGTDGVSVANTDNFYIKDNDHLVIGLDSAKFTTTLTVDLNNYTVTP